MRQQEFTPDSRTPDLLAPYQFSCLLFCELQACASGNDDSSPSRVKAQEPSDTEQPNSNMAAKDEEKVDSVTGSAPLAQGAADDHAADINPQQAPANEGLLQTPQRMASASAFSVFMSPLVRSSGRIPDNTHALHHTKTVLSKTIWDSIVHKCRRCLSRVVGNATIPLPCSALSAQANCHPEASHKLLGGCCWHLGHAEARHLWCQGKAAYIAQLLACYCSILRGPRVSF